MCSSPAAGDRIFLQASQSRQCLAGVVDPEITGSIVVDQSFDRRRLDNDIRPALFRNKIEFSLIEDCVLSPVVQEFKGKVGVSASF